MKFGKILKNLLEERNLTQTAFSKSIGYSQRAVSKWVNEESEPTEEVLFKTANFFGVSTDYLLGRSDEYLGVFPVLPPATQLSQNDRELIEAYHTLSPDLQRLLWEQIRLWQRNADAIHATHKKNA